jgi:Rod binding domain-containing protein
MQPFLPASLTPAPSPAATALADARLKFAGNADKLREVAQDFESVFLNSMFQQMFANVGQGPFGGGPGAGIWRSFLTEEYSKSFVKAGGIGIADEVMRTLLARQEQHGLRVRQEQP